MGVIENTENTAPGPLMPRARDERGASLVEYALLIALIAVVLIGAVSTFGESVGNMYTDTSDKMEAVNQG